MYVTVHLYLCDSLEQRGKARKEGRRDGFPRACTDDSKSSFFKRPFCSNFKPWKVFCDPVSRSATSIPGFEKSLGRQKVQSYHYRIFNSVRLVK